MSASTSSESISLLNGSGDPEIWDVNYVNEEYA